MVAPQAGLAELADPLTADPDFAAKRKSGLLFEVPVEAGGGRLGLALVLGARLAGPVGVSTGPSMRMKEIWPIGMP